MKTLKELMSILNIYSMKRFLCLFFVCAVGISFIGSSFISCAPGIDELDSTPGDDDERRRDRDDEDDEDDDDEGDECKGDEVCERICEEIYEIFQERIECMEKGDVKVAKLEKVHDLLMEDFGNADELENNLDKISDGDDVDRDDFGDYLEIGGTKWKEAIEGGLLGNDERLGDAEKAARLVITLKWLVEDEDDRAAKVLSSVDDGSAIFEALILKLKAFSKAASGSSASCLSEETLTTSTNDRNKNNELWKVDSANDRLQIVYYNGSSPGPIVFDHSADTELYDSLSCHYTATAIRERNVFSYAAEKGNQTIFDMAFELLSDICSDVEEGNVQQRDKACARALMCYTAWKEDGGTSTSDPDDAGKVWDMAEEHESNLKSDNSRYNGCTEENFADFFE